MLQIRSGKWALRANKLVVETWTIFSSKTLFTILNFDGKIASNELESWPKIIPWQTFTHAQNEILSLFAEPTFPETRVVPLQSQIYLHVLGSSHLKSEVWNGSNLLHLLCYFSHFIYLFYFCWLLIVYFVNMFLPMILPIFFQLLKDRKYFM